MRQLSEVRFAAVLLLCSITSLMYSCSSDEDTLFTQETQKETNHRVTPEQAGQNALSFVEQFNGATQTRNNSITVSEIIALGSRTTSTRSSGNESTQDTLFYIVNFSDNNGFIIASADDRSNPVLAYIEEGSYDENDTTNCCFNEFLDDVANYETDLKADENPTEMPDKNTVSVFTVEKPRLNTAWDQRSYADYCPNGVTGCVMTAISQICSFIKYPSNISWTENETERDCTIDWDKINEECKNNSGYTVSSDLHDQISCLMRYWGVKFNAKYLNSEATSTNSSNAINTLISLGYNASNLTDFNADNVMTDLKSKNKIIFMRGKDSTVSSGHAWVVDGYIYQYKYEIKSIYLHCNWGWNKINKNYNGYYLSNVFDTNKAVYDNNGDIITRSYNFNNNLKTSTICK